MFGICSRDTNVSGQDWCKQQIKLLFWKLRSNGRSISIKWSEIFFSFAPKNVKLKCLIINTVITKSWLQKILVYNNKEKLLTRTDYPISTNFLSSTSNLALLHTKLLDRQKFFLKSDSMSLCSDLTIRFLWYEYTLELFEEHAFSAKNAFSA